MVRRYALVASLLALSACIPRYFKVDYVFVRKDVLPPMPLEPVEATTLDLIARAQTVAFAPPSQCKDFVVGGDRSAARLDVCRPIAARPWRSSRPPRRTPVSR
jgi:hypothetical protein